MRDFSSPAALFVKVMAHTLSIPSIAPLSMAWTMRLVRVNVFPEPAPAMMRTWGQRVVTACSWEALSKEA